MATLDLVEREIVLHIAYFGALQSGAGSNVRHLHRFLPARDKGEMRREGPKDRPERVWWFTYAPVDPPKLPGFTLRVRVASIPSADAIVLDRAPWMEGLDGVVFVADARAGHGEQNLSALLDLERLLAGQGLDIGSVPMVLQVNETDAGNARPAERVVEDLNPFGLPVVAALARTGTGVVETHDLLLSAVFTRIKDRFVGDEASISLTALTRAARDAAEAALVARAQSSPDELDEPDTARVILPSSAELPVRVGELKGSLPFQHVRTEVRGEHLHVEAIWRRADGTHRKVALLVTAGTDERTGPPTPAAAPPPPPPQRSNRAAWAPDDLPGELPRLFYGVTGLLGGLLSGFLLGYILLV